MLRIISRKFGFCKFDKTLKFDDPVDNLVEPSKRWIVGGWLLTCAGGVYFMILLGGYTRLTNSGLSMVTWKPIQYSRPNNEAEWEKEFDHYKQFPEYQHQPIELEKFKRIYFVEFAHRFAGQSLGFLFLLPFGLFKTLKWIKPAFNKRLALMGGLGAAQGLIGWWMVRSGLNQPKPDYQLKPRVSTYRLMVHLSMAISIYSLLVWNAASILRNPQHLSLTPENWKASKRLRGLSIGLIHLIAINLLTGATMAGIDAGKVYNTWPLMNGAVIPEQITKQTPFWRNFFENNAMVQFNHRNAAYVTYAYASYVAYFAYKQVGLPRNARYLAFAVFGFVNYQLLTGILALLNQVQVHSGSIHQFNALNVLTTSLLLCHSLRKPSKQYYQYIKQFI